MTVTQNFHRREEVVSIDGLRRNEVATLRMSQRVGDLRFVRSSPYTAHTPTHPHPHPYIHPYIHTHSLSLSPSFPTRSPRSQLRHTPTTTPIPRLRPGSLASYQEPASYPRHQRRSPGTHNRIRQITSEGILRLLVEVTYRPSTHRHQGQQRGQQRCVCPFVSVCLINEDPTKEHGCVELR